MASRRSRSKKEGTFLESVKDNLAKISTEIAEVKNMVNELKLQQASENNYFQGNPFSYCHPWQAWDSVAVGAYMAETAFGSEFVHPFSASVTPFEPDKQQADANVISRSSLLAFRYCDNLEMKLGHKIIAIRSFELSCLEDPVSVERSALCIQRHCRGMLARTHLRKSWCDVLFSSSVLPEDHWAWHHARACRSGRRQEEMLSWIEICRVYRGSVACSACGDKGHEKANCLKFGAALRIQRAWARWHYRKKYGWRLCRVANPREDQTLSAIRSLAEDFPPAFGRDGTVTANRDSLVKIIDRALLHCRCGNKCEKDAKFCPSCGRQRIRKGSDPLIWSAVFMTVLECLLERPLRNICRQHESHSFKSLGEGVFFWLIAIQERISQGIRHASRNVKTSSTILAVLLYSAGDRSLSNYQMRMLRDLCSGNHAFDWLHTPYYEQIQWSADVFEE